MYQTIEAYSSIWNASDDQSGPVQVAVRMGTFPGGDDLGDETWSSHDYIRDEIRAKEGMSSYVTVEAMNRAGLTSTAHSQPIVLDTSLPPMGKVSLKEIDLMEVLTCLSS